jgi:6-phosphogluconolactonase (cycloisomerase 2 family)
VPDLGLDRLFTYAFDMRTGALTAAGYLTLPTGSGPRHMVFHPNKAKPYAYLLNELSNTITAFEWEPASGGLKEFQTVSALPEGCVRQCLHATSAGAQSSQNGVMFTKVPKLSVRVRCRRLHKRSLIW